MQESPSPFIVGDIISDAMSSANARMRLKSVRAQLADMFARNQFNTARAVKAFSIAIHWAVWDHVRSHPRRAHSISQLQALAHSAEHGRGACRTVQNRGRRV